MLGAGLINPQEDGLRSAIGGARAGLGSKPREDRRSVGAGVEDEERAVLLEARMERQSEQALLSATGHTRAQVEKRVLEQTAVVDDPDRAGLLGYEQPSRTVSGMGDGRGTKEPACDLAQDRPVQQTLLRRERSGAQGRDEQADRIPPSLGKRTVLEGETGAGLKIQDSQP